MKTALKGLIIFTTAWTMASRANIGKQFSYTLEGRWPVPISCHHAAAEVGDVFRQQTGIETVQSRCLEQSQMNFKIGVEYTAEKPASIVSTTKVPSSVYSWGRYNTLEECKAKIDSEVTAFESATGLEAAFSLCAIERWQSKRKWFPRIDGFGQAKSRPQLDGFHLFTTPYKVEGTQLKETVLSELAARDIPATDIVFRSHLAYATAAIHYYAPQRVKFILDGITRTQDIDVCLQQLNSIRSVFVEHGQKPLYSFCGVDRIGGYAETSFLFTGSSGLRLSNSAEAFANSTDCETKREEIVQYYKKSLKLPVLGGYCSYFPEEYKYRVKLLERGTH